MSIIHQTFDPEIAKIVGGSVAAFAVGFISIKLRNAIKYYDELGKSLRNNFKIKMEIVADLNSKVTQRLIEITQKNITLENKIQEYNDKINGISKQKKQKKPKKAPKVSIPMEPEPIKVTREFVSRAQKIRNIIERSTEPNEIASAKARLRELLNKRNV